MSTTTFDTLEFTEQLKAAGVPEDQAKAHAKALSGVLQTVEESKKDALATKGDLEKLELRMTIKMGAMILASVGMFIGYLRAFPMPVQIVQPTTQETRHQGMIGG
ncbi:MAG: CCDC90 family protein [Magnetococcus sp. XQGC-1]